MINHNGTLQEAATTQISIHNRGFNYGDAVFETMRVYQNKILYWEDHYFRLMASMRIMRMEIPMEFTPEFLEEEIKKVVEANGWTQQSARVKLLVNRGEGGLYTPQSTSVEYVITASPLASDIYTLEETPYVVELYKDFYVVSGLLSTLKTNNRAINVIGSVFAHENGYENCLLLNEEKKVIEALNGNLFLVKGTTVKTPPITDGCLKGVMRKQVMSILEQLPDYTLEEASISPFELQKADELFITNVITGIQPITQYRKKHFQPHLAKQLIGKLNLKVRLG